jgi:hypothetical protein
MSLNSGDRIGQYEVAGPLGAGGMGEVYRARDTKLNRDVAIKVLPDLFMHDAERLARFRREAQVLASLNHPNIGHIYGIEDAPASSSSQRGVHALVLELVAGPTLQDRIEQGAIWKISTGGAVFATWSTKKNELLYLTNASPATVMAVPYTVDGNSFKAEKPRPWSPAPIAQHGQDRPYDLHPDGLHIAMIKPPDAASQRERPVFVFNFFDELRRIAPGK